MSLLFMRDKHLSAHQLAPDLLLLEVSFSDIDQVLELRCKVKYPDLLIQKAELDFPIAPHETCHQAEANIANLVGVTIQRGYNQLIKELLGGQTGCVHMVDLAIEIGHLAYQAKFKMQGRKQELQTEEQRLAYFPDVLAGQCVAYA